MLLFDIFINDILHDCIQLGVDVPGLDRMICGLLFADDLVLMAPTWENLRDALGRIGNWANENEMTFGIKKCGLMGFGGNAMEQLRLHNNAILLQNQVIPVVEEYTYLGIIFRPTLSCEEVAKDRAKKGRSAFFSISHFLSCNRIPLMIRIKAVKSLLYPVLTYGSELWGMNASNAKCVQRVVTDALKGVLRIKQKSHIVSAQVFHSEFDITPIHAYTSAARTRAYVKFSSLKTVIADLIQHPPPPSRFRSWVSGTLRWLRTHCPIALLALPNSKRAFKLVKTALKDKFLDDTSVSHFVYNMNGFSRSRKYLREGLKFPLMSKGIDWLCKLRLGALWLAPRLAQIRRLPIQYLETCPCCNTLVKEDLDHLLCRCPRWVQERALLEAEMEQNAESESYYIQLLGGSREQDPVPDQVLQSWCSSMGLGLGVAEVGPGFIKMAQYLQVVLPLRFGMLRTLVVDNLRADADTGRANPLGDIPLDNRGDLVEVRDDG